MDAVWAITIFRFLLSPEDSSVPEAANRYPAVSSFWKLMKATLWITLGVIAAVILGKL